ncbi:DNA polymerase III [Clostridioides sp. ZZV15-6598]|uniref:DNA polymerase III n=1 Tax=Clostridioides sp. ZZV15-6598 TaxID=2811501 RepID=UPI001D10AA46|nr:DNA polymerase III [Clostridioides sp. ZZV15-6598]
MKQNKKNEKQMSNSNIKKNSDNKVEIAEELCPNKNIGSMLGDRIAKKKINRPS